MGKIKVISFDAEGTLVTPGFSKLVWHEAIPRLYAEKNMMSLCMAKDLVFMAYDEVGDQRMEWYDIAYWFERFGFGGHEEFLASCSDEVCYYPEVMKVLPLLGQRYELVVVSNSAREFLDVLMMEVKPHFQHVFSTISDFGGLKSPHMFLKVCDVLNLEPGDMVHVGDSKIFDYDAPSQVGVRSFYLDRDGYGDGYDIVGDLDQFMKRILDR